MITSRRSRRSVCSGLRVDGCYRGSADVVSQRRGREQPALFRHQCRDEAPEGKLVEQRSSEGCDLATVAYSVAEIEGPRQLLYCGDLHIGHGSYTKLTSRFPDLEEQPWLSRTQSFCGDPSVALAWEGDSGVDWRKRMKHYVCRTGQAR